MLRAYDGSATTPGCSPCEPPPTPRRKTRVRRGKATLIALIGNRIVGFGRLQWWDQADGTRLYLLSGCLHPEWRSRGVGRRLLHRQKEQAAAHRAAHPGDGVPLLTATTSPPS